MRESKNTKTILTGIFVLVGIAILIGGVFIIGGKDKTFKIHDKIKTEPGQIITKRDKSSKAETRQSFIGFPISSVPGNAFNVDYETLLLLRLEMNSQPSDSSLSLLFNDQNELIHIHYVQ